MLTACACCQLVFPLESLGISSGEKKTDRLSIKSIESVLQRTISGAERDGIQSALDVVDEQKAHLLEEGLSRMSFFFGVLNVVLTALVLFKYPEHLWLFYGAKCIVLIPAWLFQMIRLYNGALFILDYCWVANICFCLYMALSVFNVIPASLQPRFFLVFFASALGPLGWACILLHNGLVFHNIEKISSLFIHFTPIVVSLTIVYYQEKLATAWPDRFPGATELGEFTMLDVYLHGLMFYMAWWIPYTLWLASVGIYAPDHGRATVYNNLYIKHKSVFEKTKLKSVRSNAMFYLVTHLVLVNVGLLWAALCFRFLILHFAFGLLVFFSAAWNGAGYYEYLIANSYTKVVRKLLNEKQAPLIQYM